jgi:nucleotide-binding universal stress UspA family protein
MLERILVPLDGSPVSEAVLPELGRFLRVEDSEVVLVRAAEVIAVEPFPGLFETALKEARAYLSGVARRLSDEGVRARPVSDLGRPADFILRCVDQERATLVALATHGRTGLSRALAGSVAEEVLRRCPVPVFAVRPPEQPREARPETRPIRTILVPLDGSERSARALGPAIDVARIFGARLVLLHVLDPKREPGVPSPRQGLERAEEEARRAGLRTLVLTEQGDPVKAILETCRFHGSDLIAMATHGRTGLKRLLTGSVTESVLRHAHVPLLVVRTAEEAEKRGVA